MTIEELEAKLETVSRERDKFQALAELGEGYRRERDVVCDDLAFILAEYANERNEELTEDALCFKIAGLTHQRDEARAEVEAMRKAIMHAFPVFTESDEDECTWDECIEAAVQNLRELRRERNEAFDEVQRLTDERDELLVRVADQGAELRATREAYNEARKLADALRTSGITADDCRAVETLYAVAGHAGSHRIVEAMRYLGEWLKEAKP